MHGNRNREVVQRREGLRLHTPDDGGKDLFVHHSAIAGHGFRSLAEGAKVSYDTEQAAKARGGQRTADLARGSLGREYWKRAPVAHRRAWALLEIHRSSQPEPRTLEISVAELILVSEDLWVIAQFVEEALPVIAPRPSDRLKELEAALDTGASAAARAAIEKMLQNDPELRELFERRVPSNRFWVFVGALLQLVQTVQVIALAVTLSNSDPRVTVNTVNERIVMQISAPPRDEQDWPRH